MANWIVVLALALAWVSTASAQTDHRFGLVIGNEAYSGALTRLNRPHEDIARIGQALNAARFSTATRTDASRSDILREVRALADRLRSAGPTAVGFFYYSGHGASARVGSRRHNFLIPSGSSITKADELVTDGVPLETIIGLLENTGAKAVFVVFDACRSELPWSKGGADPDKGFDTVAARPGLFIAFSTDAGATSPDDGAFSAALAEQLVKPNMPHLLAFDEAALIVGRTRGTDRLPWYSNQIRERFYFVADSNAAPAPPEQRPAPQQPPTYAAPPPSRPQSSTLPAADLFSNNSVQLRSSALATLDGLAASLIAFPAVRVDIIGHTSTEGSEKSNLDHSYRQAEAIRAYLIGRGVSAQQLATGGLGESQPRVFPDDTEAKRAQNRRIEIAVAITQNAAGTPPASSPPPVSSRAPPNSSASVGTAPPLGNRCAILDGIVRGTGGSRVVPRPTGIDTQAAGSCPVREVGRGYSLEAQSCQVALEAQICSGSRPPRCVSLRNNDYLSTDPINCVLDPNLNAWY